MDSTSNLFSRLDLDENHTSPHHEDMEDMDIDVEEEAKASSFNPGTGTGRKNHTRHRRDHGRQTYGSSSMTVNDAEQQCRRVKLVQLINSALEAGDSLQTQDDDLESEQNKPCNEASFERSPRPPASASRCLRSNKGSWRKKGKGQSPVFDGGDLVLNSREKRDKWEGNSYRNSPYDVSWYNPGKMRAVHDGYSVSCGSPENQALTEVDGQGKGDLVGEVARSSVTKHCSKDRMDALVSFPASHHIIGQGHEGWSQFVSPPKTTLPRTKLENGCASHHDRGWNQNTSKDNGVGTNMHGECFDRSSLHDIISLGSETESRRKEMGKMIMEIKQDIKAKFPLKRLEVANEVSGASENDAFGSFEDAVRRGKAPVLPSEESVCVSNREEATSGNLPDLRHRISMEHGDLVNHVNDSPEMINCQRLNPSNISAPWGGTGSRKSRRRQKTMKGKRECNSICSNYDGSSSSTFGTPAMLHLQSSRHHPRAVDSQHHGDNYDPVIELGKFQSPLVRCNNIQEQSSRVPDHSSARISQVESDEMLARQLQDQFYDEVAGSASTEIDATLAWSLQEEDARRAASTARSRVSRQPDNREASMAHLYEYYARLPYRNSSARRSNHPGSQTSNRRRNYYGSEIDLETRMMAEVRNFTGMDSGMRRNFLEALEAAFDQSNDALALESPNEFNEYDYETLLALDENNHQHAGASESQINSLPHSIIQSVSVEEACAICLENPLSGDIIRHLPCLHKFHQDCIDPWLRRKTSCPICKSDI